MGTAERTGAISTVVALAGLPQMIRDLVATILEVVPGVRIAGEFPGAALSSGRALDAKPDVLIVGHQWASQEVVASLLRQRCSMKVLCVSSDGRKAMLHELRPHRVPIDELSKETLLRVLRRRPATTGNGL